MAPNAEPKEGLKLPVAVVSPTDLGRLLHELTAIDESLLQLGLRKTGSDVKLPKTSQLLDELCELNGLNLLQPSDRARLLHFLKLIQQQAPVLHISFGADPTAQFTGKLVAWLREEIHPQVLLTIGLQPAIGAGCVLRTTNKYFDFSLRNNLKQKQGILMQGFAAGTKA